MQQRARRLHALRAAGLGMGAAALAHAAGAHAEGLDLNVVTAADAPDGWTHLKGGAVLSVSPAPALTTRVGVTVQSGDQPGAVLWPGAAPSSSRAWRDVGVDVQADWAAARIARLQLQLSGGLKSQPLSGAALGEAAGAQNDRTQQSAGLTASLTPAPSVSLKLAARVDSADDQIDAAGLDDAQRMLLKTREGAVESALHWAPRHDLAFDAGAKLSSTSVVWREAGAAAEAYVAVQPQVAATFTPARGSSWRLGLEHAVSPLDATRFVTLARVDEALSGPDRLAPDQEWRLRGQWTQALPADGKLSLGVTEARVGSATELVRLPGDVEGPGSVRGGDRRQLDLAFSLPLRPLGLDDFALETSGVWRTSQVQDPLTGALRRASGEAPYETRVAIAQKLPVAGLRWGVDARSVGPQTYYGLAQVTSAEADQTFGAFVEYRPSAYVLRLQVDGLAGGERRWQDAYYAGDRDGGAPASVVRRTDGGPSVGVSLKKSL